MDTPFQHHYVRTASLLICALVLGTLAGCRSSNVSSNVKKAEDDMAVGLYQEAIPLLEQEIIANPTNAEAFVLLGKCNLAVGEIPDAETCFRRAKQLDANLGKDVDRELARCEVAANDTQKVATDLVNLRTALRQFEVHCGRYPTTKEGLASLVQGGNITGWKGPYIVNDVPIDPWGNPYVYRCPGQHNTDGFDLYSFGPDMKDGTADDIISRQE